MVIRRFKDVESKVENPQCIGLDEENKEKKMGILTQVGEFQYNNPMSRAYFDTHQQHFNKREQINLDIVSLGCYQNELRYRAIHNSIPPF